MTEKTPIAPRVLWATLLAFSAALPISIAAAEPLAFLVIPLALGVWWSGCRPEGGARSPLRLPMMAFAVVVLLSVLWSVRPGVSVSKLHRLLVLPVVFILPYAHACLQPRRSHSEWLPVLAFVGGACVLGLFDMVRVSAQVGGGVPVYATGNMRDPQMYMVALCFLLGCLYARPWPRLQPWLVLATIICAAGLVLHFKRGVWLSCGLSIGLMSVLSGRKRIFAILAACILLLLFVPRVRARLEAIRDESSAQLGGRYVLWTSVAPELLRTYPQGMGWRAVEHEDLLPHAKYVQPGLNHLHSNLLQIPLELGWIGLAVWVAWIGGAARQLWRPWRTWRGRRDTVPWLALSGLGAFTGLMLNGLVEYNFGDTEIVMTLCLIMGLAGLASTCDRA